MNEKTLIKFCKELGCCDACCLRCLGLKNATAYENCEEYVTKLLAKDTADKELETISNSYEKTTETGGQLESVDSSASLGETDNSEEHVIKKIKMNDICVCCMGLLQKESWPDYLQSLDSNNKGYDTNTFACGLSAPISTLLREKALVLRLNKQFGGDDATSLTPLKEAWKWTFGVQMAKHIGKSLDSGAVASLLITLNMEYPDELQELEILKKLSPALFAARKAQKRRFTVEFTRRSVDEALADASLEALQELDGWRRGLPAVAQRVRCVSVVSARAPMYLGGRYVKLCRRLPQTPWQVEGAQVLDSSVQELIFRPIAAAARMSPEDAEHRLKFMAAGREDVDVRCLGEGRPFAIEITDPRAKLSPEELSEICKEISKTGRVIVRDLVYVTKEDLAELKKGEQSKCKTYEALCVKLSHSEYDSVEADAPVQVTDRDIERMNSWRTSPPGDEARVLVAQRTPIRVLHRRPLLTRPRRIFDICAAKVPGHERLFVVRVRTEAGTYVKEWVHGDLGRSAPRLGACVRAPLDLLALDVTAVQLRWPPPPSAPVQRLPQ